MRILMISPEPFFLPRGTPFSIFHRLEALGRLGHETDLVTYHLGEDVEIKGLRIYRIINVPFVTEIKVGPSYPKFLLDMLLLWKSFYLILRKRYDCIHTHEEGCFMGGLFRKIFGIPHVYDMHSSLPEQLVNYNFTHSRTVLSIAKGLERRAILSCDAIIVICRYLADLVHMVEQGVHVSIIENVPLIPENPGVSEKAIEELRDKLGVTGCPVALYTGTFEYNQGLDLLLCSIPLVLKEEPGAKFVLVGGEPAQVTKVREMADSLGVGKSLILPGRRPLREMAGFMVIADVLLSPRKIGTNTPLKVYSYMRAGKPIVATNLLTHTQVLDETCAVLTDLTPEGFSDGIIRILKDGELAERVGRKAREIASEKYSYEAYLSRTRALYESLKICRGGIYDARAGSMNRTPTKM